MYESSALTVVSKASKCWLATQKSVSAENIGCGQNVTKTPGQVRSGHAATRCITLTPSIGKGEGDSDDEGGAGDGGVGGVRGGDTGGDTQTWNVQSLVDIVIITCS